MDSTGPSTEIQVEATFNVDSTDPSEIQVEATFKVDSTDPSGKP